jgi:probable HAF family extracellular repeat protein
VGQSYTSGGISNAFLYSGGVMINLGTLPGGTFSYATAINNSGQVVGASSSATSNGNSIAFLYSGGVMINLGTLGGTASLASGINDAGQVVGNSADSSGNQNAFLYSSATGMENLNTVYASLLVSGTGSQTGFVALTNATGINNLGDIAGVGTYWNGTSDQTEAFLLDAPEPSTWALLLGGGFLLAGSLARRTSV